MQDQSRSQAQPSKTRVQQAETGTGAKLEEDPSKKRRGQNRIGRSQRAVTKSKTMLVQPSEGQKQPWVKKGWSAGQKRK